MHGRAWRGDKRGGGGEERGNFVCLFGMEIMEDEQMGLGLS